jgi:site-specific recombinase XerD
VDLKTVPYSASKPLRLPTVLTVAEQKLLLAAPNKKVATGLRNYALLKLFLNLGLRVSEAIDLKVDDIDWQSGRLTVVQGKGGRDRVLWLADEDLELLSSWLAKRPAPSSYLFTTREGGRISDRYVRKFVKSYARKKKISKDVHPHALRHTFATDLLRKTGNIRMVQKALGHASLATTMLYTHVFDQELEAALKGLRKDQQAPE